MLNRIKRKHCRGTLKFYALLFSGGMMLSPFLAMAEQETARSTGSVFGLDPELVKGAFYLLLIVLGFFLARTLIRVDSNQSILFDNQRKLSQSLTALVTAHNINHKQNLETPKLSDSSGKE
jgi:hypothetical protein